MNPFSILRLVPDFIETFGFDPNDPKMTLEVTFRGGTSHTKITPAVDVVFAQKEDEHDRQTADAVHVVTLLLDGTVSYTVNGEEHSSSPNLPGLHATLRDRLGPLLNDIANAILEPHGYTEGDFRVFGSDMMRQYFRGLSPEEVEASIGKRTQFAFVPEETEPPTREAVAEGAVFHTFPIVCSVMHPAVRQLIARMISAIVNALLPEVEAEARRVFALEQQPRILIIPTQEALSEGVMDLIPILVPEGMRILPVVPQLASQIPPGMVRRAHVLHFLSPEERDHAFGVLDSTLMRDVSASLNVLQRLEEKEYVEALIDADTGNLVLTLLIHNGLTKTTFTDPANEDGSTDSSPTEVAPEA